MFSVIFDMDGTLLDTQRICIPAWEYAGKKQGVSGMGDQVYAVFGMNQLGSEKYVSEHFPSIDIETFRLDVRDYIEKNGVVKYKKGALELLKFLKDNNIKFGLASGSSRMSVEGHFNKVGGIENFEAIVAGTEVENGKPAPDIFLETAKRMKVKPETCYVFEDSSNGIKAGCLAGMKCIGIEDMEHFSEDIKALMFTQLNTLDEAIEIFKKELSR